MAKLKLIGMDDIYACSWMTHYQKCLALRNGTLRINEHILNQTRPISRNWLKQLLKG